MALGGGTFVTQNKILPGSYINFVSAAKATAALSDRGIATIPYYLDWGALNEMIEVSTGDLQKNSLKLFGYDYTAPELKPFRELFKNIRIGYLYRIGEGGTEAYNDFATAKYPGERGNKLKVVIDDNADNDGYFDVTLILDGSPVDVQTVQSAADLVDNDFVVWKKEATLDTTAGVNFEGGVSPDGNPDKMKGYYSKYLEIAEGFSFNAIGCPSDDEDVKGLFAAFTKRMRDEQGVKFQCVLHNPGKSSDYEGVVDIQNSVVDEAEQSLVYWVTGVIAGTNVNKSALNKVYDGEYTVDVNFTQTRLEQLIKGGKFTFHRVGADVRVLSDINSLVNVTLEKGEDFKQNQTIRVIDQIANDIAVLFNTKYLGVVPNDADGRISLWADIVKHHEQLQTIRAIENFKGEDVKVSQGDTKRSVVVEDMVSVVNAMAQLYMTCVVA
ncbi:MAG: phage tail sheath family protein [Eubacterium sp.]|jgi:hypothetical protein|nr:phage tail sheath family protein [Eubacterium sp.]